MPRLMKDDLFADQMLRAMGHAVYGGADAGECLATADRIEQGRWRPLVRRVAPDRGARPCFGPSERGGRRPGGRARRLLPRLELLPHRRLVPPPSARAAAPGRIAPPRGRELPAWRRAARPAPRDPRDPLRERISARVLLPCGRRRRAAAHGPPDHRLRRERRGALLLQRRGGARPRVQRPGVRGARPGRDDRSIAASPSARTGRPSSPRSSIMRSPGPTSTQPG